MKNYCIQINYRTFSDCAAFRTKVEAENEEAAIGKANAMLRADKRRRIARVDGGEIIEVN